MLYRSFPRLPGTRVSILGFGAMRLPVIDGDPGRIDEEAATALLHQALEAGVNYVDTAWPYHAGQSEPFVGRALAGGLRDRVLLATKCPVWDMTAEADYERVLDEQLRRLQTDHVDFYLLHALDRGRWDRVLATGGLRALERALADGRLRHLGFSFHGPLDDFKAIVGAYDWAFTQIQLNYVDRSFQAGLEGLACAAARGVGAIAMEPLRGGALARVPPAVEVALGAARRPWSAVEWALRWVWAQAGIVTLLSGMNAPQQLEENARVAASTEALGPADLAAVEAARQLYAARMAVPCTSCGYCQPCPNGVAIADVFNAWNSGRMFEDRRGAAGMYARFVKGAGHGADRCEACGDCEPRCPQHISIGEELARAEDWLGAA